jgi:hypothetical protein
MMERKTVEIDGIEYRLIPVKKEKENKTVFAFILTMPNIGSWNGKWTGSGELYARTKIAFRRGKELYPLCKEGNYYYNFGDGWGANVEVKIITPREAVELEKKSRGFAGYDWMIKNLLTTGQIKD